MRKPEPLAEEQGLWFALATLSPMNDIESMVKNTSQQRSVRTGQFVVVGRAKDGVEILRQTPRPSNFTRQEADRVIDRVKSGRIGSTTVERIPSPGRGDTK